MESVNHVAALPIELMHFFLSHHLDFQSLKAFPIVCRAWMKIEESHQWLWTEQKAVAFPSSLRPAGFLNEDVDRKNHSKAVCSFNLISHLFVHITFL
jgi:hypothetical protein